MTDIRKPKKFLTHPKLEEPGLQVLKQNLIFCPICFIFCLFGDIFCPFCLFTASISLPGLPEPTKEEILTKSQDVDGIMCATHKPRSAEVLDRADPQSKAFSTKSAGIDNVDVTEMKRRGIPLGHPRNGSNDAVANLAIDLMVAAARRFYEGYLKIVNENWDSGDSSWMLDQDIKGSTIGIVGFGGIGQKIAHRLKGFDVESILYFGRKERPEGKALGATLVSFDELLRKSDFVFVACPLTNETKNLFNKSVFEKMKTTSVLINVARGGIVAQNDLIDALKNGTIFAAGIDVMVLEPLQANDELIKLPNCVVVPHLG